MRQTEVTIEGERFHINGRPTYQGRIWRGQRVEGLLFCSRMVQAVFDDLNIETRGQWAYPDTGRWDPERNTDEFVSAMPQWRQAGLLGVTVNLQGGNPRGYAEARPWHNSALTETGELRREYTARLGRVLDLADELGMVVILGVFSSGQDQRLLDERAVIRGLDSAVDWVLDRGYLNVLLEVNDGCDVGYDHAVLRPERVHELIARAKSRSRSGLRLLVSASYGGGAIPGSNVAQEADYLLLHGDGVGDPNRIVEMVRRTRDVEGYRAAPIIFTEDDHFDLETPMRNMLAALSEYASWGYLDIGSGDYGEGYQSPPVCWGINTERKRAFFDLVAQISGK